MDRQKISRAIIVCLILCSCCIKPKYSLNPCNCPAAITPVSLTFSKDSAIFFKGGANDNLVDLDTNNIEDEPNLIRLERIIINNIEQDTLVLGEYLSNPDSVNADFIIFKGKTIKYRNIFLKPFDTNFDINLYLDNIECFYLGTKRYVALYLYLRNYCSSSEEPVFIVLFEVMKDGEFCSYGLISQCETQGVFNDYDNDGVLDYCTYNFKKGYLKGTLLNIRITN